MKLISWNVNFDARAEGDFEAFAWKNRSAPICDFLTKHIDNSTIVHLQEVMPEYITDLKKVVAETHDIFTQQVHPCGRQLLSAIPKEYEAYKQNVPAPSDQHRQVFLKTADRYGDTYINAHFPMGKQWRWDFCKQLVELIEYYSNVFITGDFNTFPDDGGFEQLQYIQSFGKVYDAALMLVNPEGTERVLQTFDPYPYDKVPDSALNAPALNLDHIFIRCDMVHEPPKAFALKDLEFKGEKYGISDHSALIISFH
jgi:endonuclease/exonuclease/phosphatase family metal-dependent hydrolase